MKQTLFCMIYLACSLVIIGGTDPSSAAFLAALEGGKGEADLRQQSRMECESSRVEGELWRKAYDQYELGLASADRKERSAHFCRAAELARQTIQADPQSDEGYKWLAVAQGAQAEDADVETQIRLSLQIKENIEKALSLDPDDDISMLVLSRWHYKVASLDGWTRALVTLVYGSLPEASLKKAEELLLEAIAKKDRIVHRYSLAKVYYRMGKREAALQQLRLALALPVTFASEAEDLERARKKLDSWK